MQPADPRIDDNGQRLSLVVAGGEPMSIEAATLWVNCPSALRRRRRLDGLDLAAPAGIAVRRATPIGNYAVNIAFSDGHDRGVYPWALLRELARRPKISDFLIAPTPCAEPTAASFSNAPHLGQSS